MRVFERRVALTSAGLLCAVAIAGCGQPASVPTPASAPAAAPAESQVDHGKKLVIGGGCHDCHTPKTMTPKGPDFDMTRMLSGHQERAGVPQPYKPAKGTPWVMAFNEDLTAWSGPWGASYAANLTPDQNTGLGIWTEDMFIRAIREGKHMGTSRPILPPMPWPAFRNYNDADLKAIFAYLKTLPAISNHVPDPVIAEEPKK